MVGKSDKTRLLGGDCHFPLPPQLFMDDFEEIFGCIFNDQKRRHFLEPSEILQLPEKFLRVKLKEVIWVLIRSMQNFTYF